MAGGTVAGMSASPVAAEPGPALRQLALPFAHREQFVRADFVAAPSNAAARAWLNASATWPELRLALWGEAGRGKTHLLRVWAHEQRAVLLPGNAIGPATVSAWTAAPAVAIDDADLACDERSLLHLLNRAREAGSRVLLAGRRPPARWAVALDDLASRLRATVAVGLGEPEEALLRILLLRLLAERQLLVGESLIDWLLARLPREADAMREAARRLDEAALAAGGAVTRALALAALADLLGHPSGLAEAAAGGPGPRPGSGEGEGMLPGVGAVGGRPGWR